MVERHLLRKKRKNRIRAKITGSATRPRLTVYRSNQALSAQIIDDAKGMTIVSFRVKGKTIAAGKELGVGIAKAALAKGVKEVVFDRSGYRFHGTVEAIAQSAREGGLKI